MISSGSKFAVVSILILLLTFDCRAGVKEGGGGNAMVCRAADQSIVSAQILDLFEARVLYGLATPAANPTPAITQAQAMISRLVELNKFATLQLQGIFDHVSKNARMLPTEITLNPIDDSFSPITQKGCAIEQLAAYMPDGNLYINSDIWQTLDETNRAALYVHESVYKMMRDRGATDSVRSRKLVGYLFSGYQFQSPVPTTKPGDLYCETPDSAFWRAPTQFMVTFVNNVATLSFTTLADNPLFDQKQIGVAAEIFGPVSGGEARIGGDWTTGAFEGGDNVMIQNIGGTISITLTNGLGHSQIKGNFPVECLRLSN